MELVLTLIISFIITWSIGLSLPLIIRFVVVRKFLSKGISIIISIVWYLVQIGIFQALQSQSKNHTALALTSFVGYYILRSGCPKTISEKKAKAFSRLSKSIKE